MDLGYGNPPDSPNYDDFEDLLEDVEDRRLVIEDPDIPSDLEDEVLPTPPVTQPPENHPVSPQNVRLLIPNGITQAQTSLFLQNNTATTTAHSKRRLEETILDDVRDISRLNDNETLKRQKTSVEIPKVAEDLEADAVMEKIRAIRQMPRMEPFAAGSAAHRSGTVGDRRTHSRICRRVPLDGDFQKLTYADGMRYFLRVRNKVPQAVQDPISKRTSLLSKPFDDLMVQARQLEEQRLALRQEQDVLDKLATWDVNAADSGIESEDEGTSSALWVERFQPRSYVDLLSEETVNRGLLRWLKLWDKAVFGREVVTKAEKEEKKKPDTKFKPFVRKPPFEVIEELDSTNRPKQRVALLCGPPGLGKTTLAHVLARHAGYNVWEMNASDDRSVGAFRIALDTATQMRPVLGRDPRPNCLVIDEIDGAPAPSIALLVSALGDSSSGTTKTKKSKSALPPIHRPVICICNDPYAAALRPLRQIALVMQFPPTEPAKLSGRLQEICRRNGLSTDLGALFTLCEKTRNDIRACLSFLQFVRGRQEKLTLEQVQTSAVGEKDHHKGLFAAWHEIFNIPRPKRKHVIREDGQTARASGDGTSVTERYRTVSDVVSSCGEYEKLAQGMFENYLNVKIKDASMKMVTLGANWLCFADEMNTELQHSQNYVLLPYQMFPGVAFHLMFGSQQRVRTIFPTAGAEARQRSTRISNLLETMVADMSPRTRCFNNLSTLVQDVLPFLLKIAQPSLRPVNSQLFSSRETEELRRVLNLMIAYNLTYQQQRDQEGQFQFVLDPNMEEVVYFTGQERPHQGALYTVKQLIAREIELEKMRRAEAAMVGAETRAGTSSAQATSKRLQPATGALSSVTAEVPHRASHAQRASQIEGEPKTAEAVPNHLKQLKAKPITRQEDNEAPRDFFGRAIQVKEKEPTPEQLEASDASRLLRSDVWYHFKEGYNNAVRRTVRVKDLV